MAQPTMSAIRARNDKFFSRETKRFFGTTKYRRYKGYVICENNTYLHSLGRKRRSYAAYKVGDDLSLKFFEFESTLELIKQLIDAA